MDAIEIVGNPRSTYTRVVRMACEEKGVPYTFTAALPHTPPIDAIHPFGKVPVMRCGDIELYESKAIATYIDRACPGPKLIPDDPLLAAQVEKWISLVNSTIDPVMIREYVLGYALAKDGKPDPERISAAVEKMKKQIPVLDAAVANGYLVGDHFTLADINLMPILFYLSVFPEGAALLEATQHLKAYFERHAARPSFKNTIPPPLPKR
jgi:glutathione S-transferase